MLRPSSRRAFVQLIVLGLRELQPHHQPAARKPCLALSTGESDRNPNFCEQVLVPVDLPDNHIFCPSLEARVLDELFGGVAALTLGVASIDFSTRIPWQSRRTLEYQRRSVVYENQLYNAASAAWVPTIAVPPPWSDHRGAAKEKAEAVLRGAEWEWADEWTVQQSKRTDGNGWEYAARFDQPHWAPNPRVKAVRRRLWYRVQQLVSRDVARSKLREGGMVAVLVGLRPARSGRLSSRPSGGGGGGAVPSGKGAPGCAGVRVSELGGVWAGEKAGEKAGEGSDDEDEELVPEWLSGRMECPGELEALIEERPFERWEVLASEGASAVCGSLKGLLRVVRREEDAPIAELPVPLAELLTPALHVVRLYVLRAEHLMPADASGTSDPYLRITLGDTTISTRERKISRVTDAEFYERFELRATLPGEAELRIEVMDHDLLDSDDLIGYTKVDLEDRVFSREWRELGDLKPLEWRPLHSPYSNNPQGRLQLWVDVFPLDVEAPPPPPCDITPPGEQRWELRVIVWRTRDVLPHDYFTEMNDLYAVVAYGTAPAMHTDTHWRCRDGCGSFNWRCKFPLRLDHRRRVDERLTVQLWDRDVLKYNDNIGEVVVPLQRFFAKAFRARVRQAKAAAAVGDDGASAAGRGRKSSSALSGCQLEGDPGLRPPSETSVRTALARLLSESAAPLECVSGEAHKLWLPLHAKSGAAGRPKSAGWVEVSVELVPAEVAEAFPAGAGRAEPNDMPKLPPPTGRVRWSFNPLRNMYHILGPKLCAKFGCAACLTISLLVFVVLLIQMVPVLAANLVTELLLAPCG